MKEKLLLLLITLLPSYTFAQQAEYLNAFDAEKTVWTYRQENEELPLTDHALYTTMLYGDTIIDNIKWKIFTQSNIKGLTRMEGSKVLFRAHPDWSEYWWVGAPQKKDTTVVAYDFSLKEKYANEHNIPVDSIKLNDGRMHKRIMYANGSFFIEGIGDSASEPFENMGARPMPGTTMGFYERLVCCHVNDELLYMNPAFVDCDGTEVPNGIINKEEQSTTVTVTDNQLQVLNGNGESFDVKVYTMEGKLVAQQNGNRQEATIPISHLAQGVYLVQVVSDRGIYTRKIMK